MRLHATLARASAHTRAQRPAATHSPAPSSQDIDHFRWVLMEEAQGYLPNGSPEAQVFRAVLAAGPEGLPMADLKVRGLLRASARA